MIRRGATFRQWQDVWKKWLSGSYAVKIPSKKLRGEKEYKPTPPRTDQCYSSLTRLLGALDHYITRSANPIALASIQRKVRALVRVGIEPLRLLTMSVDDMRLATQNLISSYVEHMSEKMLAKWKEKSVAWEHTYKAHL